MTVRLECLTPPLVGRALPITVSKPAVIRTTKGESDVGDVTVRIEGGSVVLINHSRMHCQVNGSAVTRAELHPDDRVTIGKQIFRLVIEADGPPPVACSVCDKAWDANDDTQGWQQGEHRICRLCQAKGVRPNHLAQSQPADQIPRGDTLGASDSDRQRKQRRLSASRLAQVDALPQAKQGLFSKVGAVFSNREERKRFEVLDTERRSLLEQAGRLAVSENNGFGIPDHLYNPLLKGIQVGLRLQDFSIPAIERWRAIRSRLTVLDAEIAALRAALQLGPDPSTQVQPPPLASDQGADQERAFAMMDSLQTVQLDDESLGSDPLPPPPAPARPAAVSAASGRRPLPPLRRRR